MNKLILIYLLVVINLNILNNLIIRLNKMYFLRCISKRYSIWLGILLVAKVVGITAVCAEPIVSNVRMWEHPAKTRFVVDLTEKIDFEIETLTDPYRLVINLPPVNWRVFFTGVRKKTGVVQNWRNGHFDYKNFNYRIVLDLSGPVKEKVMLLAPDQGNRYRLVVDLIPSTRRAMLSNRAMEPIRNQMNTSRPFKTIKFAAPGRKPQFVDVHKDVKKIVVVIDPGHGGMDPGATTNSRIYEKHVVLAIAKAFKRRLERNPKYKVYLTRNKDIYIRLRKRIAIARINKAALFVSLHADAIKSKKIRGMSFYTLSEKASSKEAAALAEKENRSDLVAGVKGTESDDVTEILIDLAQNMSMNKSSKFAEYLLKSFRSKAKILPNPHRQAGFAVLKSPDTISVLIELGFLSNTADARALTGKAYRERLSEAFVDAVVSYCNQPNAPCSAGLEELN